MMFKPRVCVSLEISPGERREVCRDVEDDLYEIFEKIDAPRPGSDVHVEMICARAEITVRRLRDRRQVSAIVGALIAEELVKLLGAKDTENGYPKRK